MDKELERPEDALWEDDWIPRPPQNRYTYTGASYQDALRDVYRRQERAHKDAAVVAALDLFGGLIKDEDKS